MSKLDGFTIGILGGDQRERVMMESLLQQGAQLKVLGDPGGQLTDRVEVVTSVDELTRDVQVIVGPMSGTNPEGMVKARYVEEPVYLNEEFFRRVGSADVPVLIGMTNARVKALATEANVKLELIATRDDVAILNAIPTAEGALQVAMENLPITIHGSYSLVMGMGKCGLPLAWRLRALGSEVYGVTRSSDAIAKAQDLGIHMISYEDLPDFLPEFDLIFNTVPAMVLPDQRVALVREDALIVDLASAPGGTDFEAAEEYGVKAILALGLPGKVAYKTSGQILGRIVPEMILEVCQ